MAEVPIDQNLFNTNVPAAQGPQTHTFGQAGRAMENFGVQAENEGIDIYQKIRTATALSDSQNQASSDTDTLSKYRARLLVESPDGFVHEDPKDPSSARVQVLNDDGKTYHNQTLGEAFHDKANEIYQSSQDKLSDLAQPHYRAAMLPHITSQVSDLDNLSLQKSNEWVDTTQMIDTQRTFSNPANTPYVYAYGSPDKKNFMLPARDENGKPVIDPGTGEQVMIPAARVNAHNFYDKLMDNANYNAQYIGVNTNGEQYLKDQQKRSFTAADEVGKLIYDNLKAGRKDPDELHKEVQIWAALDWIKSEDADSKERHANGQLVYRDIADPVKRERLMSNIIGLLPQAREEDHANLVRQTKNLIELNHDTPQSQDSILPYIKDLVEAGDKDPKIAPEMANLAGELAGANQMGQMSSFENQAAPIQSILKNTRESGQLAMQTSQQLAEHFGIPYTPAMGYEFAKGWNKAEQEKVNQITGKRSKDEVGFLVNPEPDHLGNLKSRLGPDAAQFASVDGSNTQALNGMNPKLADRVFSQVEAWQKTNGADRPQDRQGLLPLEGKMSVASLQTNLAEDPSHPGSVTDKMRMDKVNAILHAVGKRAPVILEQLVDPKKGMPSTVPLLANMPKNDPNSAQFLVHSIYGNKGDESLFKDSQPQGITGDQAIQALRYAATQTANSSDFVKAKMAAHPYQASQINADYVNLFVNAAMWHSNQNALQGGGPLDADTAVNQGYQHLTGNFVHTYKTGSGESSSTHTIPKVVNNQPISNEHLQNIRDNEQKNLETVKERVPFVNRDGSRWNDVDKSQRTPIAYDVTMPDGSPGTAYRYFDTSRQELVDAKVLNKAGKPEIYMEPKPLNQPPVVNSNHGGIWNPDKPPAGGRSPQSVSPGWTTGTQQGRDIPSFLNSDQRKMLQQYREHTK